MTNLLSVLAALLVFAVIIVIHEAGHFFAARAVGIPVCEFSVGFGPKIFSTKRGGVLYSLRVIFLGGYVRFFGDDDKDDELAFPKYNVFKRMLVMASGVIANTLVAILVAVAILMFYGEDVVSPAVRQWRRGDRPIRPA
jgi:regulator of sigma E protease